jgi:hypothetical protein
MRLCRPPTAKLRFDQYSEIRLPLGLDVALRGVKSPHDAKSHLNVLRRWFAVPNTLREMRYHSLPRFRLFDMGRVYVPHPVVDLHMPFAISDLRVSNQNRSENWLWPVS